LAGQKSTPQVVTVTGQQRVVQIEDGEGQLVSFVQRNAAKIGILSQFCRGVGVNSLHCDVTH
jgi:hypothetical protein